MKDPGGSSGVFNLVDHGTENRTRRGPIGFVLLLAALAVPAFARAGAVPSPGSDPPPPARRIVSLAPNITEMLFAIGAGSQVVGVTDYCDYPPEARTRPKVGGFVNPNPEAVLALAPDLIVATPNVGNRSFVEHMMRAGARVEIVEARNLEEIFPALDALGRVSGHREEAAAVSTRLHEAVASVRRRVGALPRPAAVICIQRDPLIVAGPGSYPHDLLLLAGGRSIVPDSAGAYPALSMERVIAAAPEVIIQTRMDAASGAGDSENIRRWWSRWPSLPAVLRDRVHVVDGDTILRPGPRVALGLEMLVGLLHPETRTDRDRRAGP
jgi:iron complex transport system substrate-binding protein